MAMLPTTSRNNMAKRLFNIADSKSKYVGALPSLVVANTTDVAIATTKPLNLSSHRNTMVVGRNLNLVAADATRQRSLVHVYWLGEPDLTWGCVFQTLTIHGPTKAEATNAAILAVETLPQQFRQRAPGNLNCARWCTHATAINRAMVKPMEPHDRCTMQITSLASLVSVGQHLPIVFVDINIEGHARHPARPAATQEPHRPLRFELGDNNTLLRVLQRNDKGRKLTIDAYDRCLSASAQFASALFANNLPEQHAAIVDYVQAATAMVATVQASQAASGQPLHVVYVVRPSEEDWRNDIVEELRANVEVHTTFKNKRLWSNRTPNVWQVGKMCKVDAVSSHLNTWEAVLDEATTASRRPGVVIVDSYDADLTTIDRGPTVDMLNDLDALGMARLMANAVLPKANIVAGASRPAFRTALASPGDPLLLHAVPNLEGAYGRGYYARIDDLIATVTATDRPTVVFGTSTRNTLMHPKLPSLRVATAWWCPNNNLARRMFAHTAVANSQAELIMVGQEYRLFCTIELDGPDWAAAGAQTFTLESSAASHVTMHQMKRYPVSATKSERMILIADFMLKPDAPLGNVLFWIKDGAGGITDLILPHAPAELHATTPYRLVDIVNGVAPKLMPPPQHMAVLENECKMASTRPPLKSISKLTFKQVQGLQSINREQPAFSMEKAFYACTLHEDPFEPVWRAMVGQNPVMSLGYQLSGACMWSKCAQSIAAARLLATDWVRTMEVLLLQCFANSDPSSPIPGKGSASYKVKLAAELTDAEWAEAHEQTNVPDVIMKAANRLVAIVLYTSAKVYSLDVNRMLIINNSQVRDPTITRCNSCDQASQSIPKFRTAGLINQQGIELNLPSVVRICNDCVTVLKSGHRTAFSAWNSPYNQHVETILDILHRSHQPWHSRTLDPAAKIPDKLGLRAVEALLQSPVATGKPADVAPNPNPKPRVLAGKFDAAPRSRLKLPSRKPN